jgi:hypothetical protein
LLKDKPELHIPLYILYNVPGKNMSNKIIVSALPEANLNRAEIFMQFTNYVRNEFNKCDVPENTLDRISKGLDRLELRARYSGVQASERLFWGRVWIDSLHLICEGKGTSRELAQASAYAELVERFIFRPCMVQKPGLF